METSTKILLGAGIAIGVIAVGSYLHNEHLSNEAAEAAAAQLEIDRRKEERFLMGIVMSYRLDHALQFGMRENINYVLLDSIITRELNLLQLIARKENYQLPAIKAQATSAQLVGRFGVVVELTALKVTKS